MVHPVPSFAGDPAKGDNQFIMTVAINITYCRMSPSINLFPPAF
jgi:hypothetical protein